jgi:hypothetical protein
VKRKLGIKDRFDGLNGSIIHWWPRKNGDAMLLSSSYYRGQQSFDLRQWYKDENKFRPTKRGVRFRRTERKQLIEAISKLKDID